MKNRRHRACFLHINEKTIKIGIFWTISVFYKQIQISKQFEVKSLKESLIIIGKHNTYKF